MNIRLARVEDIEKIIDIMYREKKIMKEAGINQWDDSYPTREIYINDINREELFLVEVEGKIGAFGVINKDVDKEYEKIKWSIVDICYSMHRVIVDSSLGIKGLATALFQHMEKLAKDEGIKTIHIDTYIENYKAQKLFIKLGYRRVEEFRLKEGMKNFVAFEKNFID